MSGHFWEALESTKSMERWNGGRENKSYLTSTPWPDNTTLWNTLNTLGSEQSGWHLAGNIFKCIFLNENVCILIQTVLYSPIDKNEHCFR